MHTHIHLYWYFETVADIIYGGIVLPCKFVGILYDVFHTNLPYKGKVTYKAA